VLSLALPVDIYLCVQPTDMRKSFNGLWALAVEHLGQDPLSGGLFVFVNRRRDLMKLLYWDTDGIALWCKRLERGTFQMPRVDANSRSASLSATELTLLLRGIDLKSVRQRKRYRRESTQDER
jgi:transposase